MGWFSNLKIRNKLLFVFGVFACALTIFTVFASVKITNIGNDINELFDSIQTRQIHIADAKDDFYKLRLVNISNGYLADDDKYVKSFTKLQQQYVSDADSLTNSLENFKSSMSGDPRLAEMESLELLALEGIEKTLARYIELTSEISHATNAKNKEEVVRIYEEAVPIGNQLTGRINDLNDQLFYTTRARALEISESADATVRTITTMTIVLVAATIILLLYTVRSITRPIRELRTASVEIAGGNLNYPVRNGRKDELGVLSNSIGDMVDKLSEQERLKEALETARKATEAKSSFLANMSHEIRTPMNAILGVTEIQLQNEKNDPETVEAFTRIYNSGDMLLGIINDILDLSKIESGKLELIHTNYDIGSLINDTVTLNMMRIGSKPIKFELDIDENIPSSFTGDELRIKQILNNVLSNAIKYTDEGIVRLSVSAEVWTSVGNPAVNLIFSVSDTGRGMTKEQVELLFNEYSRFDQKANQATEGTGLGMSITKKLIDLMYGSISVESEPGKGSLFTVKIPQIRSGSGILGKETAEKLREFRLNSDVLTRSKQIAREPMPYGRVLVVDDVESNLHVVKGLLKPYELSVDTAVNGQEAIDMIESGECYDLVFMDHMMPGMDGIETVLILRNRGYTKPIVALTANAVTGQAEVFLSNGFDGFVSKPIDVRQLDFILKKFVKSKKGNVIAYESYEKKQSGGIDRKLAEAFVRDASRTILELERISNIPGPYSDEDLKTFTIHAHSMKSALLIVKEEKLSALAADLEKAGQEKDMIRITDKITVLLNGIKDIKEKLSHSEDGEGSDDYLVSNIQKFIEACEFYDQSSAKRIVEALKERKWPPVITKKLEDIVGYLFEGKFDEAANEAEEIVSVVWEGKVLGKTS